MVFNSYTFLLLFLPLSYVAVRLASLLRNPLASLAAMGAVSSVFYAYASLPHYFLLLASIGGNYLLAFRARNDRFWLGITVTANLLLLAVMKYSILVTTTARDVGFDLPVVSFALPLAISFYTFHQISFQVDLHRGRVRLPRFAQYAVYVLFFPQLVAGPIVRYHEIAGRLARLQPFPQTWGGWRLGMVFLAIGVAKKVLLADTMALYANPAFDDPAALSLIEAWVALLAFAYQIYFDFSGYSDIAIGIGLMLGIRLPNNFASPYKSASITDFWRRWHMSLSRFLRDYLYIPLGGNRRGRGRQLLNLMTVMVFGGLWHGASWTFAVWGVMHGLFLILHQLWRRYSPFRLPVLPAVALTFLAVVLAWLPFRARDFASLQSFLGRLFDPAALVFPERLAPLLQTRFPGMQFGSMPLANVADLLMLAFISAIVFLAPNTRQIAIATRGRALIGFACGVLLATTLIMLREAPLVFIYFNF
jgi:D-alanyl-lipoteichoic acid acyltransferase DltB (MBOAT superfamily)